MKKLIKGANLAEYALILALVSVAASDEVLSVGQELENLFTEVDQVITDGN